MKYLAIVLCAVFALASSAEVLQGPSVKTVNYGPDGSVFHTATLGGSFASGLTPITTYVHSPILRTVHFYPDGAVVNEKNVGPVVASTLTPVVTGLQGPSTRTVNIGADGSVVDSFSAGGVVADDGSVISPSIHSSYGHAVHQVVVHNVVPEVKSVAYSPVYYSGYVPIPYAKSIVAGPSGTIVA